MFVAYSYTKPIVSDSIFLIKGYKSDTIGKTHKKHKQIISFARASITPAIIVNSNTVTKNIKANIVFILL